MTDRFAHLDAAYALGALEPADAADFETHLSTCAQCRERVDRARSTAALLAGVSEPFADDLPPDTLLPGLLRRARRERNRRTRFTAAVAALSAACLVALAWVSWGALRPHPAAPTSKPVAFTAVHGTFPVEATAQLTDRPWGTQITVHCSYDDRGTGSRPYRLVVVDRDGGHDNAGSWKISAGQSVSYTGGTAVRRERIARVQVTLADGTPILQLVL